MLPPGAREADVVKPKPAQPSAQPKASEGSAPPKARPRPDPATLAKVTSIEAMLRDKVRRSPRARGCGVLILCGAAGVATKGRPPASPRATVLAHLSACPRAAQLEEKYRNLREAFKGADLDNSGFIDPAEFHKIFKRFHVDVSSEQVPSPPCRARPRSPRMVALVARERTVLD